MGYHLVNLAIHNLTGILLFFLFKTVLASPGLQKICRNQVWIAFFAALLWMVHPVQTQSVTYVVQRMNSLAGLFYILSILCYARGRTSMKNRFRIIWFFGCVFSALLAMGSKEIAATLPVFLLLYEWFFVQNLSWQWFKKQRFYLIGVVVFVFIIVLLFLGTDPLGRVLDGYRFKDYTPLERVLTEFRVIAFYLGLFFFPLPTRFSLEHDMAVSQSILSPPTTFIALVFIAGLLLSSLVFARKKRLYSFAVLWFLGNLVIESSVIPLELVFEHRMYLPSMFLCLFFSVLCFESIKKEWLAAGIVASLVLLGSVFTYARNDMWREPLDFHRSNVVNAPNYWRAHSNYGLELYENGFYDKAIDHFTETLELEPRHLFGHVDLALAYTMKEEYEKALQHYDIVLQAVPEYADVHYKVGYMYRKKKDHKKAIEFLSNAVQLAPELVNAHIQLGYEYAATGKFTEAIVHFQKVLLLSPKHQFEMQNNLGISYAELGDYERSIFYFSKALLIQPGNKKIQHNLDLARQKQQSRQ
jgi:tetratricopeptide (TPR) repeat protein